MSHLRYYSYDGVGKRNLEKYYYSQAVRIENRIECAGQGGWNAKTGELGKTMEEQIEKTFQNIELNLKDAGGAGWSQVYKIRSYHTELSPESLGATIAAIRKWCPDHAPVWTCVGVTELGEEGMVIEMEVEAQVHYGRTCYDVFNCSFELPSFPPASPLPLGRGNKLKTEIHE